MKTGKNNLLLLFLVLATFASPVLPPAVRANENSTVSTATRAGRLAVFDDAWSTIHQRYYDRTFRGLDWESQRTTYRALASEANSAEQLYAVLRRMIGLLNDPHTRVFSPEEKFDWWRPRIITTGLIVREIEGHATVVQVEANSAPHRAGIRIGDVIKSVNGEAVASVIGRRLQAGTSRSRVFASLLEGAVSTSVEILWEGKNGVERIGRFNRYWQQRELGLKFRREKGIAVIEIDAFTSPISIQFANLVNEKLNDAKGIILDLRNNGGGDAEAMTEVASAFLSPGQDLGQFIDRAGASFLISTRGRSMLAPARLRQIQIPLVVLTSERTSSAAEILTAALKATKRARVVGTQSCGCVLATRARHILPDGGLLDVSELDYQTANGEHLERHGIKPDDVVTIGRKDLYLNRDSALEFAIRSLGVRRLDAAF